MIRSMTGFGQARRQLAGYMLQIDIKSVNHRYCEIVVRMPREWLTFEDMLRKQAQQTIRRGRVDIFVNVEPDLTDGSPVAVNWPVLDGYFAALEQIRNRLNLPEEDRVKPLDLLMLPDVIAKADLSLADPEPFREELRSCMDDALRQLADMRTLEGAHLREDLQSRIHNIARLTESLEQEAPRAVEHMRNRLAQRLQELLGEWSDLHEERLVTEAALLAERSDIDEEITRLKSQCKQFRALLDSDEPVGRKLDFLTQEMIREANTVGSKGNFTPITNLIVELKSELEKIREQVQNIE